MREELHVKLPSDFCEISNFFNGSIWMHSFLFDDPTNLIEETLRIRKAVGIPDRFIVLAEHDMSVFVMDTENKPSIIWLDSIEISLLDTLEAISEPDIWNDFSDFFEYLLDDEEEERNY
ncbi:SMI1/KNR4 family protein [Flavobacterium sp. ACN2]|uniref:SMI1/KNR4 family protein n=1 Tax=Flavobacterium sp. ACN2 TaxID=1975676 RepID=UPI001144B3A3|nr:SMI1/KNR4 family protein [Flavobacterium sp. ACN2]